MSYVPPHRKQPEIRYKSIIIPTIGGKYVVVKDAKSQDVTFIGGGCGKKETIHNCAIRELSEETRKSITINRLPVKPTFSFTSQERFSNNERKDNKARGIIVTMVYNVFIVDMGTLLFSDVKHKFNSSSIRNETNNIFLMNRGNLVESKMWDFMRRHILPKLK